MAKCNLNSHGTNTAIKFHILSDEDMKLAGFTDHVPDKWFYFKVLDYTISFNVTIPKNGSEAWIDVLDEDFGQPYDYQALLDRNDGVIFAKRIKVLVEAEMGYLAGKGIISGHNYGDYI